MQSDLTKTKKRAMQYFYSDGSFEITFGGMCLLLALYFYLQAAMPESLLSNILNMGFVVFVCLAAYLINLLVNRFKERVTYPRSGYITYQQPKGVQRTVKVGFMLAVSAIIGGSLAAFITHSPRSLDWMPGLTGFVLGAVLAWIGFRVSLRRFYGCGILILLSGFGLSLMGIGNMRGLAFTYAFSSLVLLLSGSLTLWQYLKHNPAANETTDAP